MEQLPSRLNGQDGLIKQASIHCSLNGVKLSGTQAKIAKGQGMLSGVPDLFLPVPKNGYHGLFIEMKSEKGR